jgi:hypothetical protein
MKKLTYFFGIILICGIFQSAHSYDWEPFKIQDVSMKETCVTYDAKFETAPMMQVLSKTYLQTQPNICPNKGICSFRQKSYLVPEDYVFASAEKNGFRCVYYGTAKGDIIAGFLPASSLKQVSEENKLTPEFIKGTWSDGENWVKFTLKSKDMMHIEGMAIYESETPNGEAIANTGSISADAKVGGDVVYFREGKTDDGGCTLQVRRRGPYLILKDNLSCGGQNVRFWSIFSRKNDKTSK